MRKYSDDKNYKVIAYCISRFHRDEQKEYIDRFCQAAGEYGCKVMIFSTLTDLYYDDINDHGEKQIYSVFDVAAFDAVVIMSETFKKVRVDREVADRAIAAGIPVISINRRLDGCVNLDFTYKETFEQIVRHIVEDHGCRKVNYIGGDRESRFSRERFECYRKVLAENGIPFEKKRTGYGNFVGETAVKVLEEFLREDELPEAIICANDSMAMGVCTRLKELNIRVPEDVKVTGFDGIEFEKYHNPRLTTAAYDLERTVKCVFETLRDIWNHKKTGELIIIPYKMQIGHSCGCQYNRIMNPADKLLKMEEIIGSNSEYFQSMLNMNAECDNCEEISAIFQIAEKFAKKIAYKEYWLCINTFCYEGMVDRIPMDMDELLAQVKKNEEKVYSDQMVVACHSNGKQEEKEKISVIERTELVPGLPSLFETEHTIMFLPMHLRGITIGYLAITFEEEKLRSDLLNVFLMNLRNAIEGYWSGVIKEQLFSKDELTGLLNRRGFEKQKERMFRKGNACENLTLIALDMDNLKKINDNFGHTEGDIALRQLGKIIESVAEKGEICARMGGDEFMMATVNPKGSERAIEIQDAIHRKLREYNQDANKPYELWTSIGFYTGQKVEIMDYEAFVDKADSKMYQDKKSRKQERN